jgi:hypothetical protein
MDRPAAKRVLIALVALVMIVGVVAAVKHTDAGPFGDARLRTDGLASLTRRGVPPKTVSGTVALLEGDVVEAVKGTMTIDVAGGAQLEGRAGSGDAEGTKVLIPSPGQPAELMVGELLVSAAHGVDIEADGNRLRLEPGTDGPSAARLSRSLAVGAGVYRGTVTVDSAGQRRTVRALREIEVAVLGRPPADPKPLTVSSDDPWDRRYLGAAIDLGLRLEDLSASYTRTLRRTDARTVGFYRSLLPALAAETTFTQAMLDGTPDREQGEILVGSAIAGLGRKAAFDERWKQVFDFRDQGAAWGLIALDQGVSQDPLLAALDSAVNGTGFEFAQPAGSRAGRTTPTTGAPGTTTTVGRSGPGTTSPPTTDGPPPTSSPTPTVPPITPPTVPPITPPTVPPTGSQPVDGLVDTVNQVVGGLLGQPPPSS